MAQDSDPDFEHLLTPRQREIRGLLRHGFTNGEIARQEQITEAGVKYHVTEILNKLGVNNRWEAGHWPDDPPWGAAVFAPFALLWRKLGALFPFDASSAAQFASGPAASVPNSVPISPAAVAAGLGALALLVSAILPSGPTEPPNGNDERTPEERPGAIALTSPTAGAIAFLLLTPTPQPPPATPPPTITPEDALVAASIAAGGSSICLLSNVGRLYCWGVNDQGQLGDGTSKTRSTPGLVKGLEHGVTKAGPGMTIHNCALQEGEPKCWGANAYGQLGDGTHRKQTEPVKVDLDVRVTDIGAGNNHTCVVTALTTVFCWGDNTYGQLGAPTSQTCIIDAKEKLEAPCSKRPLEVCEDEACSAPLSGVIAIAVGSDHTCALLATGDLKCWGLNDVGQLGAETSERCKADHLGLKVEVPCSTTPVDVIGLEGDIVAITAGGGITCALTQTDEVWCWGDNTFGQLGSEAPEETCETDFLGQPIRTPCSRTPAKVHGLGSDIIALDAGGSHTCARSKEGKSLCWGLNSQGQLGTWKSADCPFLLGTVPCSPTPIELTGTDWIDVSAGPNQTCAVHQDGSYVCWGGDIVDTSAWRRLAEWMRQPAPSPTSSTTPAPADAEAPTPTLTSTPTPGKLGTTDP